MSADNYYCIYPHPLRGGFTPVMEFDSCPGAMLSIDRPVYPTVDAAWGAIANEYTEYETVVHPSCRNEIVVVAAMSRSGVIGHRGKLPWHCPEDLARFRDLTMGHPVIMGSSTYRSLPRPLEGRTNIVLSNAGGEDLAAEHVCPGVIPAIGRACASPGAETIYVIGGARVYEQMLPLADRVELTILDLEAEGDTHFPANALDGFTRTQSHRFESGVFDTYVRTTYGGDLDPCESDE